MDFNDENIEWLMETSKTVEKLVDDSSAEINKKLETFFNLLETEFLSKAVVKENTALGVLSTEEGFRNLLRKLKAFGYFFAVRTSRTSKGRKLKIFHKSPGHQEIEYPYSVSKCVRLYCSASLKFKPCPAFIIMRQVILYKDFPRKSNHMNQKLHKAIANGTAKSEHQLWVSVSLPRAHNHAPGTNDQQDRRGLDVDVKATMFQITADGNSTVDEVKSKLKSRIDEEFAGEGFGPSPDNRAFFPSDKVIYNHLRENGLVKSRTPKSNDLESLRQEISEKLKYIQEQSSKIDSKTRLKKIIVWLTEFEKLK